MLACVIRWQWWLRDVEASLWAEEGGASGREGLSPGGQGGVYANQEGQLVGIDHWPWTSRGQGCCHVGSAEG